MERYGGFEFPFRRQNVEWINDVTREALLTNGNIFIKFCWEILHTEIATK